jgi:hypothetical protein
MKSDQFKRFVSAISREFGIPEELIFERTKKRLTVDARQTLFYLCDKHDIPITYVQDYMKGLGLDMAHSTIIHGKNITADRLQYDEYLKDFIESL